eukprot:CAMPEP_0203661006 /NCGR_PEP_ID=MMETSP0088-20131115/58763_1 /ASSEMBLY_ACC=CAM_ASM_001087 /TAXON_ID=426623 /ORGANISM="Chaetoceros affinis, Strain CCMP159" /LENGTH=46 /DNA_ID= /DNA_START= /DNA_END= /DNA_ORIENTATION=
MVVSTNANADADADELLGYKHRKVLQIGAIHKGFKTLDEEKTSTIQ